MNKYRKEQIVEGVVTGIEDYGIFVNIDNEYTGLIHISEISDDFVRNINDYVKLNEKINAKIIDVIESSKHLKLSIKETINKNKKLVESKNGFRLLEEALPKWVDQKLKEYKK